METDPATDKKDLSAVIANLDGVAQNYGLVVIVVAAVLGVVLAGYSAMKLHRFISGGDGYAHHPQGNPGGYVLGIVIGGLLTISSVIVGWFGLLFG